MKQTRGALLLLLAALVWGFAFAAQTSAAASLGAFTFNAFRSLLAAAFLFAAYGVKRLWKGRPAKGRAAAEAMKAADGMVETATTAATADGGAIALAAPQSRRGNAWLGGAVCGVILCLAMNLQQFGIAAYPDGGAVSGRSGFLTTTYVVMVALAVWVRGKRPHPMVLAAAAGCMLGMYLLSFSGGLSGVYLGDVLVFLSAVCLTGYILAIDYYSGCDSLKISAVQFLVAGVLSLVGMALFETPDLRAVLGAWLPLVYTGVFSSGIGNTLQLIGQRDAEPAVASIVMSFESVFAAVGGWLILQERLSGGELLGCGLMFLSVLLAQAPDILRARAEKRSRG